MRRGLTGKRAVWLGMLATPALIVAAVTLLGVTAGSAGPSQAPAGQAVPNQAVSGPVQHVTALGSGQQTLAELRAYWTPERMANATPFPTPTASPNSAGKAQGAVETVPQAGAELRYARHMPDGSVETGNLPTSGSPNALTEPYHTQAPFTRWEWFGRYLRNIPAGSPNVAISTVHKMFFSSGGGNFVCSSSSIGPDGVWTAGHCVHEGGTGSSADWSTNVLFCPSYDSAQGGVNPTAGCWGADELWTWPGWFFDGNLEDDMGGGDATENPTIGPQTGLIGNYTGWNGLAYFATDGFGAWNTAYMALGYPQASPFNGGKIHVCSAPLAYVDDSNAGAPGTSVAIGCDMTGGSSGGPWLISFGKPGQIGGGAQFSCCNFLHGHNDWAHVGGGSPEEMNAPYFNCRALDLFHAINDTVAPACP